MRINGMKKGLPCVKALSDCQHFLGGYIYIGMKVVS